MRSTYRKEPFTGVLDGNGHKITTRVNLFEYTAGAVIKDLVIEVADINGIGGGSSTFWLVITDRNSYITNCYVKGSNSTAKVIIKSDINALLMRAVRKSSQERVITWLQTSADVNARDENGNTALIRAVSEGKSEIITALLQAGADVNAKDKNGRTALIKASIGLLEWSSNVIPNLELIVATLLQAGANVNVQDRNGDTALIVAATRSNLEIIAAMLQAGADVNVQNKDGRTALMEATRYSRPEFINILLDYGADTELKDEQGRKAIDFAVKNKYLNNTEVLARLRAATKP